MQAEKVNAEKKERERKREKKEERRKNKIPESIFRQMRDGDLVKCRLKGKKYDSDQIIRSYNN